MFRWIALCVVLCGATFAAVYFTTELFGKGQPPAGQQPPDRGDNKPPPHVAEAKPADVGEKGVSSGRDEPPSRIVVHDQTKARAVQFTVVSGGRVQAINKQDAGSERDGKLLFLATEIKPGEAAAVPEDRKIRMLVPVLGIKYDPGKEGEVPPEDRVTPDDAENKGSFRLWKESDPLKPGTVVSGTVPRVFRKLIEGERVEKGQLLALVDPILAQKDLEVKVKKLDVAKADLDTSKATKREAQATYDSMVSAKLGHSLEEIRRAKLTVEKYEQEELGNYAKQKQGESELSAAITILQKHQIRSDVAGVIKMFYKRENETIKTLEPVMQVIDPEHLRVEAYIEVQDLGKVREGQAVTVEPSNAQPPSKTLSGHLQEVTCVAVSKGPNPTVVSGSEDRTLRGWDPKTGMEKWSLQHRTALRSVACTGPNAAKNLVLAGAADGSARLIDLDDLNALPRELDVRHKGPVTCVAFSPDGTRCATGGDDRMLCIWDTETGKPLHRFTAHKQPVTSVQFASEDKLVSAGRDNVLSVWNVKPGQPVTKETDFDRRGGDVPVLGVHPDGKRVLYDQGKELRVLSMDRREIEGVLHNFGAAANFTTMALFSPKDGKTILTATASENRLQLWRTPTDDGRAGELRQFIWSSGATTCGAFAPDASFAVTGTQDHQVLIWALPDEKELNERLTGRISLIERSLDAGSSRQVRIRVDMDKPGKLITGSSATIVVPPPEKP